MQEPEKILITGSSGVVGKHIIDHLIKICHPQTQIVTISRKNRYKYDDHPDKNNALVLNCYGDLRLNCLRLISQFRPTTIYHCAGIATQNFPFKELYEANVLTTMNLLEACKYCKLYPKFAYMSSSEIHSRTPYGTSKLIGESLFAAYRGLPYHIFRFPAVAGAFNTHGVVSAIVKKLLSDSPTLDLFNNSRKPFVYAPQLAEKIIDTINDERYFRSHHQLFPTDTIYVDKIAKIAMDLIGVTKEIKWNRQAGDELAVTPLKSEVHMYSSTEVIKLAIKDILREEYGRIS